MLTHPDPELHCQPLPLHLPGFDDEKVMTLASFASVWRFLLRPEGKAVAKDLSAGCGLTEHNLYLQL